jgi:hypothetical protein
MSPTYWQHFQLRSSAEGSKDPQTSSAAPNTSSAMSKGAFSASIGEGWSATHNTSAVADDYGNDGNNDDNNNNDIDTGNNNADADDNDANNNNDNNNIDDNNGNNKEDNHNNDRNTTNTTRLLDADCTSP